LCPGAGPCVERGEGLAEGCSQRGQLVAVVGGADQPAGGEVGEPLVQDAG
jgi:hypothetical protein